MTRKQISKKNHLVLKDDFISWFQRIRINLRIKKSFPIKFRFKKSIKSKKNNSKE